MAYRRRYLSGQSATTVVIAEGAITSDKIVDGAVTHPKLAPGSVDSEKVINESLKSEDIQDGQIKTVDLSPGSVTTEKILDGAVTTQKLEASIQGIARPLTPGVDTDEIQDAKVTLAKLAPDSVDASKIKPGAVGVSELAGNAVETGKVKDAQITLAKMAPDSIDNTVIKANTIRGTEIAAGSCGESELGTDSVVSDKIKDYNVLEEKITNDAIITRTILDDAVTEPKLDGAALARRHIESKDTRVISHVEEFGGVGISNKWRKIGDAGGYTSWALKDGLAITTGAVNGNAQRIDWAGQRFGLPEDLKPLIDIWISSRHASLDYLTQNLGLWNDANNHIVFYAHDVGGATPNWFAKCVSLGAVTSIDTGVPIATSIQLLNIEYINPGSVKFYIDGIEKAEVTTNIPTTFQMEPRLEIITRSSEIRWFTLNYFSILARRPDYV